MAAQKFEEQLECPICFETFQVPKVLPCQHTFCLHCLDGHIRSTQQRSRFSCPECRSEYTIPADGASGFPTNITMQRFLELGAPPNAPVPSERLKPSAPPLEPEVIYVLPEPEIVIIPYDKRNNETRRPVGHMDKHLNTLSGAHVNNTRLNERGNTNTVQQRRTIIVCINDMRTKIRRVLSNAFKKQTNVFAVVASIYCTITFSRLVAGGVKLSADCKLEKRIAEYLIVKSCFAAFFWGFFLVLIYQKILQRAIDNVFVEVYIIIEASFSLIWLIVGSVWIFGCRQDMPFVCPIYESNWNQHFANFAIFLTVVDWTFLLAFGFYACYVACDFNSIDDNDSA